MKKSQEIPNQNDLAPELEVGEVYEVPEGSSLEEQLIRGIITSYQEAYNKFNEKNETRYWLTITNHKVATPEGNKDVAYLRIERGFRPKGETNDDAWSQQLIHQEVHVFKNMNERVDSRALWKRQLFMNATARLCHAGLEYAELLRKMKAVQDAESKIVKPESDLVVTDKMPEPLTKDELEYKQWLDAERKKEGIN